jgi:predicted Zn-dependent protease
MAGFFYRLGRMVGPRLRKANWVYRSLTGTAAEAITAEHAVGRDLAQAFLQQLETDGDPAVRARLDALGARLSACVRERRWRFQFLAVRAPEVNAFALPGGFIFVTRRLLAECGPDQDGLAFVLGHEIAHVIRRHAIDRLMAGTLVSGVLTRLPLGGGLVRSQVAALLSTLLRQGYSQDQELEADAVGLKLARAAGFDGAAAGRLLARLAAGRAADPLLFSYLSSHPPLEVRLRQLPK